MAHVKEQGEHLLSGMALSPAVPSPDDDGRRWSAGTARWLLLLTGAFALIYALFYPPLYTSIDEASNFSMAYVLRRGTIYPGAGFFPSLSPIGPYGLVYRFPVGFASVLALVSLAGWQAFFLVNPLLHVAAAWCFARILQAMRLNPKFAALYLLYPGFVLFSRTLFADTFAASLTTIALFLLLRRRWTVGAGLCLGLALTARSASAVVAVLLWSALMASDWARRTQVPLWKGRALRFGLGLLPFVILNLTYNFYTMGSPFKSTYNPGDLTGHGLLHSGRLYVLSLLLLYPGMLLAPFFYRGSFWRQGLAATTLTVLLAASYDQSTYGNSFLQTLLATPRQVLPVLPFYLLAYCAGLSRIVSPVAMARVRGFAAGAALLLAVAALISYQHQKYLVRLVSLHRQVMNSLPPDAVVYASKDVFKLHQPVWDRDVTFRELPVPGGAAVHSDLSHRPVFVALSVRSRGFEAEDWNNRYVWQDVTERLVLGPRLATPGTLSVFPVVGVRPNIQHDRQ